MQEDRQGQEGQGDEADEDEENEGGKVSEGRGFEAVSLFFLNVPHYEVFCTVTKV